MRPGAVGLGEHLGGAESVSGATRNTLTRIWARARAQIRVGVARRIAEVSVHACHCDVQACLGEGGRRYLDVRPLEGCLYQRVGLGCY